MHRSVIIRESVWLRYGSRNLKSWEPMLEEKASSLTYTIHMLNAHQAGVNMAGCETESTRVGKRLCAVLTLLQMHRQTSPNLKGAVGEFFFFMGGSATHLWWSRHTLSITRAVHSGSGANARMHRTKSQQLSTEWFDPV